MLEQQLQDYIKVLKARVDFLENTYECDEYKAGERDGSMVATDDIIKELQKLLENT